MGSPGECMESDAHSDTVVDVYTDTGSNHQGLPIDGTTATADGMDDDEGRGTNDVTGILHGKNDSQQQRPRRRSSVSVTARGVADGGGSVYVVGGAPEPVASKTPRNSISAAAATSNGHVVVVGEHGLTVEATDDLDIYDGRGRVEMSLDDAEEDDEPSTSGSADAAGGVEVDGAADRDDSRCCDGVVENCRRRCCGGCAMCCRRLGVEVRSAWNDVKSYVTEKRRRHPCNQRTTLTWVRRLFPCTQWIPKYTLKHLRGDVVAGLTTGFSVIPQGLAYGQIVELPAVYGLYSAFMGSFAYAIFGTAKDVAVGPSVIVSILAATYATGNSPIKKDPTYAIILALFTGIIQAAMGLLRLGFLFQFVSLPVLKAFRAAAGITIFMSRIKKWWGLTEVPRDFLPQLYWTLKDLPKTNIYDLLLGGLCILLLFTFKKLKAHRWKGRFRDLPLGWKIVNRIFWFLGAERNILVVIISSAIVYGMIQNDIGITYTGNVPKGIPEWKAPNFTLDVVTNTTNITVPFWQIASDIGAGFFFVPLIGILETISVGKAFGRKGNYQIDINQELFAVGLGNILSSFVSGHPITGAFLRSGINFNSGVKTPAAGIIAAAVVLVCLTVATPLMYYIPVCAMAATIMMGGIDVVTFHKFGIVWNTKRADIIPWLVTFIVSLTWGIQFGVFIGVGIDLMILLYSAMRPSVKSFVTEDPKVKVVKVQPRCGLLFPAADYLTAKINDSLHDESMHTVLLDLSEVVDTDTSIIQCIKLLQQKYKKKGVDLLLYNAQPGVDKLLKRTYLKDHYLTSDDNETDDHNNQDNQVTYI